MKKKAVIFDMDGVLVDTEPLYFSITKRLLNHLDINLPEETLHGFVGISATTMWGTLRRKFNLAKKIEELISLEKEEQYKILSSLSSLNPIEGVLFLLEELHERRINLSIASSSPRTIVDLILEKTNLSSYFNSIVCGEDVINGKPNPDIFYQSSYVLQVSPEQCLVIEDSSHGIAGAKRAGMKCVGFQNRNSGNQDLSRADLIVTDFSHDNRQKILDLLGMV